MRQSCVFDSSRLLFSEIYRGSRASLKHCFESLAWIGCWVERILTKARDPAMSNCVPALPKCQEPVLLGILPATRAWWVISSEHSELTVTHLRSLCYFSVCPSQQVAAAYILCPWTRGQDLWLHAVSTEVFLPDRAAGNGLLRKQGLNPLVTLTGHFSCGFRISLTLGF